VLNYSVYLRLSLVPVICLAYTDYYEQCANEQVE
jgi:hypothetical protein